MKTLTLATLALAMSTLVGCAQSSGHYEVSREAANKADITFIGIPTALGLGETGTTFPVSETMSLTAKHVHTMGSTVAEHPDCDVKLIRHNNKGRVLPTFANVNLGDSVSFYGYNARNALPVESTGTVQKNYTAENSSVMTDKCIITTSTAGGVQGMSGGPVYDKAGHVIGVMIAVNTGSSENFNTVFVPYVQIQKFLQENMK